MITNWLTTDLLNHGLAALAVFLMVVGSLDGLFLGHPGRGTCNHPTKKGRCRNRRPVQSNTCAAGHPWNWGNTTAIIGGVVIVAALIVMLVEPFPIFQL